MTRIDFYVLETQERAERYLLACRLIEKAYRLGHSVRIVAGSETEARVMDDLLWTFRQGSFIPHEIWGPQSAPGNVSPVVIATGTAPAEGGDVLVNLGIEPPEDISAFRRIVEVVDQQPEIRDAARQRFRYYKSRGLGPETHHLAKADP